MQVNLFKDTMAFSISQLDIYGVKPEFYFFGKSKHKTVIGAIATVITICLSALFGFLFGTDFFFRTNPVVVSQEVIGEKSPIIYPTAESFPVFFSLINHKGESVNAEEVGLVSSFSYTRYTRTEEGNLVGDFTTAIYPKKCSETSAANNEKLKAKYNLEKIYCLDWEEMTKAYGKPLPLGGLFDENEFGFFRFQITNCFLEFNTRTTSNCKNAIEMPSKLAAAPVSITFNYPDFFFDVDSIEEPIKNIFESKTYNIMPTVNRIERFTFEQSNFEDDIGWIFKDVVEYSAIRDNKQETEVSVNPTPKTEDEYTMYYTVIGYLGRKTTLLRRRYMKIQELTAMTGGFVKVIHFTFQSCVSVFATFRMNTLFFKALKPEKTVLKDSFISGSHVGVVPKPKNQREPSFFEYLGSLVSRKKNFSSVILAYYKFLDRLKERLDMIEFIKIQDIVHEKAKAQENNQINKTEPKELNKEFT